MPSRTEHNYKDRMEGRGDHDEVHEILDQFAHYPDMKFLTRHRKFLHHEEGIEYIHMRFGEEAAAAAADHVIMDCGWVPKAADYYNGRCDEFGQEV